MNDNIALAILDQANIPKRYADDKLGNCLQHAGWKAALDKLRHIVNSRDNGHIAVLCGARGTGKTRLACEQLRWSAQMDYFYSRFELLQDYIDFLRRPDWWTEHAGIYLAPRILVIDECAKAGDSAFVEQRLYHLVNKRYNDLKHTVLITAAAPDKLEDILGPSVADRINHGGAVIHLDWPSFRSNNP